MMSINKTVKVQFKYILLLFSVFYPLHCSAFDTGRPPHLSRLNLGKLRGNPFHRQVIQEDGSCTCSSPSPSLSPRPSSPSNDNECTTAARETDLLSIIAAIEAEISAAPPLVPQFVRAAFHDCITATQARPSSGCNGSLRLASELNNDANRGLSNAIGAIERVVVGTCMSIADGIQVASAVALRQPTVNGPDVLDAVYNPASPRADATDPDVVDGELPDDGNNFTQLSEFYARKGFSVVDLVASSAGAHSLGGEAGRNRRPVPFTVDPGAVSNSYAYNLVQGSVTGQDLPGFHTLDSDTALIMDSDALQRLVLYAGCAQVEQCTPDQVAGLAALNADFAVFLIKMSRLTGDTVGRVDVLGNGL